MENAANAVSKLFATGSATHHPKGEEVSTSTSHSAVPTSTGSEVDPNVDSEVAPAVEHTHVKKQHETREQTFVEKEVIDLSVTHKRVDVKETIQEPATYGGVKINSAVSVERFEKNLNGEK